MVSALHSPVKKIQQPGRLVAVRTAGQVRRQPPDALCCTVAMLGDAPFEPPLSLLDEESPVTVTRSARTWAWT